MGIREFLMAFDLLENKVAIVTGAASGIGRAIALRCAREGASVVVADRRPDPREGGTPTAEMIVEEGHAARFVSCDVRDPDDIDAVIAAAAEFGPLGLLVNNAGILRSEDFLSVERAAFDEMFAVNVAGSFFMAQAAARPMVDAGSGVIINLSSVAGMQGTGGFVTYCASKGAVRSMTMAMADELGPHGVRVCALHPGMIDTSMLSVDVPVFRTPAGDAMEAGIPLRRAGQPEDVAGAVVLLASDLAGYVTGASLLVDGGMLRT